MQSIWRNSSRINFSSSSSSYSSWCLPRRTFASQAGHGHGNPAEVKKWYYYSGGALVFLGLAHVAIMSLGEEHEERHEYSHMSLRKKPFPWGDGDTPMMGKPHSH